MEKLNVCWISAGVSSFVAGYLAKDDIDKFIYIDIEDQHSDSLRFIHDCELILEKDVEVIRNEEYRCVDYVCRSQACISTPKGAPCTKILKKRVRKQWEQMHTEYDITYFWGFDSDEQNRADRIIESMPQFSHRFPLIEKRLTKADAHGVLKELGIKRPAMYDLGYNNNNCVGCVKGGKGYWNKIRVDFPEVFLSRSKLERDIGRSIIRDRGKMIFLDELDPHAGRMSDEIMDDCGIYCQLAIDERGDFLAASLQK